MVYVGQGRQGRGLCVVLSELVDSLLGALYQARHALPALAYHALLVPGELVDDETGDDQRDLPILCQTFKRREQRLQPVVLGELQPYAGVDQQAQHGQDLARVVWNCPAREVPKRRD